MDTMKPFFLAVLIIAAGTLGVWLSRSASTNNIETPANTNNMTDERQPVLVELFTSEGCSSCPPADRVLTTLQYDQLVPNAEVITLAFHVDYWNYLGWKDRFSSSAFSDRQAAYARHFKINSSYTPQMIVDGSFEFVGSNRAKANQIIAARSSQAKTPVNLDLKGNRLTVSIADIPPHADATVYLATAESKLITKVGGGENSGSTLEHTAVVRDLLSLGTLKSNSKSFNTERDVPAKSDWKVENLKYVVFVQENASRKVLAVKQIAR